MRLYTFYNIISSDFDKNQNYILSTDKNKIILPYIEIFNPMTMMNEIKYNIKNMFDIGIIQFIEEIIVSYIDIQNEILIEHIKSLNSDEFRLDQDIFLLCGMITNKKNTSKLFWVDFDYSLSEKIQNPIFAMTDMTIQKSLS